jgi:hypothetical protein
MAEIKDLYLSIGLLFAAGLLLAFSSWIPVGQVALRSTRVFLFAVSFPLPLELCVILLNRVGLPCVKGCVAFATVC